jgi:hypothetical protein
MSALIGCCALRADTAALATGVPSFQDFPLSWTVHPKYANTVLKEGRMQVRRYNSEYPQPAEKTEYQRVYVLMGGESSERQVRPPTCCCV